MPVAPYSNDRSAVLLNTLFILLLIGYAILGWVLLWHIPYSYPFGGPDELMHLSMADYIAKHLSWPNWDSREVVRNAYGVSYSAGGSIVYWLHGLCFRLFGHHRIGAYILLLVYLSISVLLYRKNRLAGYLLLAALLPQALFVFSYVNSDSGTIITALLFGVSVGLYVSGMDRTKHFMILFFFAGMAVTARQHLWAIALLTLVWTVIYKRQTILAYDKKIWLYAVLIALLPASWWFVTSYLANAGDILGVFTNAKSIMKFGNPDLPSLARPWSSISLHDFAYSTLVSLYASWGWMSLTLHPYLYTFIALIAILFVILLYRLIDKKIFFFFMLLLGANFGFMLLYSTFYDYQAQGRYLFPSFYIIIGIIAGVFVYKRSSSTKLLWTLVLLALLNLASSTYLTMTSYIDTFLTKPVLIEKGITHPHYKSFNYHIDQFLLNDGKLSMRGWLFDTARNRPFDETALLLDNGLHRYRIPLDRELRPDVAAAFGKKALDNAGFSAKLVDMSKLEKSHYRLLFEVRDPDGKTKWIDLNQSITLK